MSRFINTLREAESKKVFLFVILSACVYVFVTPYKGVTHDGVLYTAKAFKLLLPDIFEGDIFFKYGFQDSYTIFPVIYAALIEWTGYHQAALIMAITGQLVFVTGIGFFIYQVAGKKILPLFMILLVTVEQYRHIFDLFEFYQTSRPFSAGLVFIFLAALTNKQWFMAIVSIVIAVLLHPLIALTGLIVGLFLLPWRLAAVFSVLGLAGLVVLVAFNLGPFGNLLQSLDDEWLEVVRMRSPFLFVGDFERLTWRLLYFFLAINLIAYFSSTEKLRRIFLANIIATTVTVFASWLLIDQFHNVLVTQLQPWRIIFLFYVISILALAYVLTELSRSSFGRLIIVYITILYLHMGLLPYWISLLVFVVWYFRRDYGSPARIYQVIAWVILGYVLFHFFLDVKNSYRIGSNIWDSDLLQTSLYLLDRWNFLILLILLCLYVAWTYISRSKYVLNAMLLASVVLLISIVDKETGKDRTFGRLTDSATEKLQEMIPVDSEILWSGGLENTWYDLNRRFYVSRPQAASVVFSREYAMTIKERSLPVFNAGFVEGQLDAFGRWGKTVKNKPDYSSIVRLCEETSIDFILIENPVVPGADENVQSGNRNIAVFQCSKLNI